MKKIIIPIFLVALFFSACQKNFNTPEKRSKQSMDNLTFSQNFDWKTTKDYQLTVSGNKTNLVVVSSTDKKIAYQTAYITANEPLTMKLTLPATADSVILNYLDNQVALELKGEFLNYTFK